MSREIKFRAWDEQSQTFEHFDLLMTKDVARFGKGNWTLENLQQFTGIKDFNNVDIYEGDILEIKNEHGEVKIIVMKFENHHVGDFLNWEIYGFRDYSKGTYDKIVRVIGNIYQNPDLLKEQV